MCFILNSFRLFCLLFSIHLVFFFFFFNDTATTEIYTLSLHDALPIWRHGPGHASVISARFMVRMRGEKAAGRTATSDRKSTRLNSSHLVISYAVFCLKKKKKNIKSIM